MSAPAERREVAIRHMEAADISAVSAVLGQCPEAGQWSPESLARATEPEYESLVATDGNEVAGFLIARRAADEYEILNLAVSPSHRRRSIATKLVDVALESARCQAARSAYLEVRTSNAAAIEFYRRQGFAERGRRPHYYRDPVEDALQFARRLDGSRP